MTFEANILDWMEYTTGLATVKQAPYSGARPASPYGTFQINTVAPLQHGYKVTTIVGETSFTDRRFTQAVITVSANVYADKGYSYLTKALSSNDWWEARMKLLEGDIKLAFQYGSAPINLTGLGDTDFRSRWQSDFTFYADLTHERTRYVISQWDLAGQFGEIQSEITYP